MERPFDVFLSHNSRDKPAVREICAKLRERGLRPWLDAEELIPGRDWQKALESILATVPTAAVFLGSCGLGPWEEREMRASLQQLVERGAFVIPVLLPGAPAKPELPLFLQAFTWVDLRGGLHREGIDRLVWGITEKRPAPSPAPAAGLSPPPLHNLPFESLGDLFKGREAELAELEAFATSPASKKILHGLGGIGKTRLAVEHAWRYGAHYRAAFFVRADTPAGLRAQIAALAGPARLRLPERQGAAEEEVFGAVLTWLRENPGWLLILDNVDTKEAAQAVRELLPQLQGGKVLVTSRLSAWPASLGKREVEEISAEEAARFLLERTQGEREETAGDAAAATRLAGLLDGLPLALEQAGAYIAYHHISFAGYLDAWERTRGEVLAWYDDRVMDYPRSLAVTWQQTVEHLGPGAAAILRLAAYLAPDPIPVALFESGEEVVAEAIRQLAEEIGQPAKEESTRVAVADLAAYSMIEREDSAVVVHRLVQQVTRTRIPAERQRAWIELALRLVARVEAGDPADVRTWPVWDPLRPHAVEVLAYADAAGILKPTGGLMSRLSLLLDTKGLFAEAERLYRRALYISQAFYGDKHPNVAICLNNLAQLLQTTNHMDEAEPLMRRALDIHQAAFGNEHPSVAIDLNNLAQILKNTKRLDEAEPLMRRALYIDQAVFGGDHPNVARDLNNLAQLLKDTKRLDEAEPLMRRALDIDQAAFGNDHPSVAIDLNNLAALLQNTNRLGEAEPLMQRALDIDQAAFGNDHPNVAIRLNNLAALLQNTNRLDEAEPLVRRAVAIWERSFGPDHPTTKLGRENLEFLLAQKGEGGAP
jgi:tetratricopeptide (TPR) repeat protein